ncbi:unnamed protein product [Peniophora sp. CBMAI 1063]|nr:unnamed protein product [Peniophora sp. CBMAI 1063]
MSSTAATALPTSSNPLCPPTPAYDDPLEWFTAYAVIHMLSDPSRRVTYILWLLIAAIVLVYAAGHYLLPRGGGFIGAYWAKFALRRRTWRKQHSLAEHRQPIPLPSNAQLAALAAIVVSTICFMLVGPDYIAPDASLWSWHRKRAEDYTLSTFYYLQPQYTIDKAFWTTGGRAGLIAFALFPLTVLFALKAPPFALFANPWTINVHFDKLAWLHRWSGRLIWAVTTIHVVLWSVQLALDTRTGTNTAAYHYAWGYSKFIYAWIAYALLTALVILSLRPFRERFYETFYFLHVASVLGTLVFSALHHPPVWWWCWAALLLWAGERLWRGTRWLYTNGFIGSKKHESIAPLPPPPTPNKMQSSLLEAQTPMSATKSPYMHSPNSASRSFLLPPPTTVCSYVPPTGYAHIELLAGRTMRVTLATPGYISWAPGQHFLLTVPCISRFLSHPFTCASICDEQIAGPEGRTLVFYVRSKAGWTRDFWDGVVALLSVGRKYPSGERHPPHVLPPTGVLMRAIIDGPFGSVGRTEWGEYSTAVLVAGGSGLSFVLPIFEYLCLCMAGRNGRYLGGRAHGSGASAFKVDRVHLVWVVREFSHIQWGARVLRRCQSLVSREHVQIDIFVTRIAPGTLPAPRPPPRLSELAESQTASSSSDTLAPPHPSFASIGPTVKLVPNRPASPAFSVTGEILDDYVDLSYYTSDAAGGDPELDYTNFDGDDDARLPGESAVARAIKKEGRMRRAHSRRASEMLSGADDRQSKRISYPPGRHKRDASEPAAPPPARPNMLRVDTTLRTLDEDAPLSPTHLVSAGGAKSRPITMEESPGAGSDGASVGAGGGWRGPKRTSSIYSFASSAAPGETAMSAGGHSRASSIRSLMPSIETGARGQPVALELAESELTDIRAVAEFARAGRPNLTRLLGDEAARARGPLVVACCGPTTLNAVVRKTVAAQIDPEKVRSGDLSGLISLVAEDYEY